MTAPAEAVPFSTIVTVWLASILALAVAAAFALPLTFLLMLFLGNVGLHLSFVSCYPGALVLSSIRTRTAGTTIVGGN